ncbi:MAG TPA: PIN domain-containing protein [Pyrinomonadaceae bacterium]|nr:PIN domain-containing protein [Pyrinomonadaceae bacterium]
MSFAVDTNVLLRSIDDGHAGQPIAQNGLLALRDRGEILSIFPQNLIEIWAVATRPLANNGLGWGIDRAEQELAALKNLFVVLADTDAIIAEWERLVVHYRVMGKQAHDAHLVASMLVHHVTHLVTFNDSDFKRFHEITALNPRSLLDETKS